MESRLITPQEAAKRLKTSDRSIREQIKQGRLPGIRVGREFRVDWEAIERQMDARAAAWTGR